MMWEDLKVGSIIKLVDKEHVPADIIILSSTEENGEAYCSTATLDGERTLKPKESVGYI
jgi:magnesium-transporting ATPase (P-type)